MPVLRRTTALLDHTQEEEEVKEEMNVASSSEYTYVSVSGMSKSQQHQEISSTQLGVLPITKSAQQSQINDSSL